MNSYHKKFFGLVIIYILFAMASCSNTKTLVVLLPDENSPDGAVAIEEGDRTTILDEPNNAVEVNARGHVENVAITDGEVEEVFSKALAFQPLETISFLLYFEEGTTVVVPDSRKTLADLFEEVAQRQAVEVQVTGYTDTVGNLLDNDVLSQERAQTIKEMLVQKGLRADFIRAVGRGERELLISTPDNVREPKNRRVQVIVR